MNLTNDDIQEILRLLDATQFDELHLETERFKLTLKRHPGSEGWTQETQQLGAPHVVQNESVAAANSTSAVVANGSAQTSDSAWIEVRAHLPGTFYRAPKPGAPPFVEVGSRVESETVVGIVETMKLMNAVHAEASGEIAEICCENARFTEKGTVLMRIKPGAP